MCEHAHAQVLGNSIIVNCDVQLCIWAQHACSITLRCGFAAWRIVATMQCMLYKSATQAAAAAQEAPAAKAAAAAAAAAEEAAKVAAAAAAGV